MTKDQTGWIGLGNMGKPMALKLLKAGYPLIVYNRSKEKEKELLNEGAISALSPKEVLEKCKTIFIMISDDAATREIFIGENGILSSNEKNRIIINMSTVSSDISNEMSGLCIKYGHEYLDAPVSGSVKQAETAQLAIMVGGKSEIYEKSKPYFEYLGKMNLWVGDTGTANSTKLAINSLLATFAQGLCESLIFAENKGIKKEDFMTLINNSALGNAFAKFKGEAIINNDFKPAFALKHMIKDLKLAKSEGLNTPLGEATLQTFKNSENDYSEEDVIAIYKELKKENK